MNNYELLLAAFRSGQMTPAQFIQHLADDEVFAAWFKKHCQDVHAANSD